MLCLLPGVAGPGEDSATFYSHAVQVVGYDNERQAWLARNSWGSIFGMRGYFWVNFSAPGMCDGSDTFGLTFIPDQREVLSPDQLQAVRGQSGCYTYKAQPGDYPEKLVDRFGLGLNGLQRLVRDNLDHMPELDRFTPGASLLVCDPDPRVLPANQTLPAVVPRSSVAALDDTKTIEDGALWMAASPQVLDSRSAWRGLSVLGPVKDQGVCFTGVAFSVLAAAETAAAVALNTSLPAASLSAYELHFCSRTPFARGCGTGWQLEPILEDFLRASRSSNSIALEECVPYTLPRQFRTLPESAQCQRRCKGTAAQVWRGTWKAVQLRSVVYMQRHILTYGSVICRLPVYSDIRKFSKDTPNGIYRPCEWFDTSRGGCCWWGGGGHRRVVCAVILHMWICTVLCTCSCSATLLVWCKHLLLVPDTTCATCSPCAPLPPNHSQTGRVRVEHSRASGWV
jgi:hypothetical protein